MVIDRWFSKSPLSLFLQGCWNKGGRGEGMAPYFDTSVFPISTVKSDYAHHITTCAPPQDFQTFLRSCLFLLSSSFVGTEIIVWLSIDRYIMEKLWNWKIILPLGGRKMFFIQNVTHIGSVWYIYTACSREIVHKEELMLMVF